MPKKKKYMVVARDKKTAITGLITEKGGHRSFGRKTSAMWISDPAEAREIDQKYGLKGRGDVFVAEDEKYSYAVNGEQWDMKFDERGSHLKTVHHYTFGPTSQFSQAWEEFEQRRKARAEKEKQPPKKRVRRRKSAEVTNAPNP